MRHRVFLYGRGIYIGALEGLSEDIDGILLAGDIFDRLGSTNGR